MLYYREHSTCCIGNMVHVVKGTWYMLYYRVHGTCCIGNMVHVVL